MFLKKKKKENKKKVLIQDLQQKNEKKERIKEKIKESRKRSQSRKKCKCGKVFGIKGTRSTMHRVGSEILCDDCVDKMLSNILKSK